MKVRTVVKLIYMKKIIILIFVALIVAAGIYFANYKKLSNSNVFVYQQERQEKQGLELSGVDREIEEIIIEAEKMCEDGGGHPGHPNICSNLCRKLAKSCSNDSGELKIGPRCVCSIGKCWNGKKCVIGL